eukprot:SAG31_NODE_2268_length_6049_cov_1.979835_5_plen_110_part_00
MILRWLLPLLLLILGANAETQPLMVLRPHSLQVIGATGGFVEATGELRLRWALDCEAARPRDDKTACRGLQQRTYRAVVSNERGELIHDSGTVAKPSPFCTLVIDNLEP